MPRLLFLLTSLGLVLCPLVAGAQIVNGDFEDGINGWSVDAPNGWTLSAETISSSCDGASATIVGSGDDGTGCLSQTFVCGTDPTEGVCTITFDYNLSDPAAVSQIEVRIDGQALYTDNSQNLECTTGSVSVSCGTHTIELCMVGRSLPPALSVATFDNITAVCEFPLPNESSTWGQVKSRYE